MALYKECAHVQDSSDTEGSSAGDCNQESEVSQPAVLAESNVDVPAHSSSPAPKQRLGSRRTGRVTRQLQNMEPA